MSENHCFVPSCLEIPQLFCKCQTPPLLLCKTHQKSHNTLIGKHKITEICSGVHEDTKKPLLKLTLKLKSELNEFRCRIIQEELSLIKKIQEASEKARKQLKDYDKILNETVSIICRATQINNLNGLTVIESLLKLSVKDFESTNPLSSPSLKIKSIDPKLIYNLFTIDPPDQLFTDKPKPHTLKHVWNLRHNELKNFDASTLKLYDSSLPTVCLKNYNSKCLLPDGNLFLSSDKGSIIITPQNIIRHMPSCKLSSPSCSVYANGNVYLFNRCENKSVKYNVNANRWYSLCTLPVSLGENAHCNVWNHCILLTSQFANKLINYDINIDSCSEITSLKLSWRVNRLVFVGNNRIFLLEFTWGIYESSDLYEWERVGTCPGGDLPISHIIKWNKKIYYECSGNIYAFDLRKTRIEKIMVIDI